MLAVQHYNSSALDVNEGFENQTQHVPDVAQVCCRENLNITTDPTAAGLSMTLGIVSNIVALIILAKAYARLRKRSKATFLLFASSLVVTDLAGHVIPGALVLHLYVSDSGGLCNQPDATCRFLGGSMVFFGLCPLFLGCVMAAERCMGVTRPLLHSRVICMAHTKMVLVMIWLLALSVALLPSFGLGTYTYQHPGTWCFINVLNNTSITDVIFVLLFSGLGLAALAVALVCNTISGVTLVNARLRKKKCHRRSAKSHDIEMVAQLVGIMVTSCICWSPLLIFGLMSVIRSYSWKMMEDDLKNYRTLMVTGVRLAALNQILDPWVYILLRRAVLRKIYRITTGRSDLKGSTFRRWEISSFQNSIKSTINRN
ncbi:prostaglandin E2 receptor EP1 subtype-like [Puntigrus tetrazona]|uniref:prostaglandin E2 receptor EP1 subtype-like n=1 Tax=Puntigrus tetrazona TaxID=1606681 RepID=UPI001C897946|nr:prostaglandin E2 receptor EP1 subtype-like [Puntigrus tetrazona]XP_043090770.1 prostaglandin E2 receptor EP1 subtype-like [Puntigrus tetrazona]XP_043090771.1 prostaglandin E2 receptor EP1 subtype-like [Puntigrus tetrazona]